MEKLLLAFAAAGAFALSACQQGEGQGQGVNESQGGDNVFRGYQETEPARETAPAPAQPSTSMPPTTEGLQDQASEAIDGSDGSEPAGAGEVRSGYGLEPPEATPGADAENVPSDAENVPSDAESMHSGGMQGTE